MDTICRLCITKTPALTSVFSFKNDRLITDMISLICPVKIDPSDSYPKSVCLSCLRIITEAYELRERSVQSDFKLKTGKVSSKFLEPQKPTRTSSTRKSTEPAKLPEVANIKVEKDPFNSAIEFVDESYPLEDDQYESNESGNDYDDDYDDDDYQEIIPVEPTIAKKSKYQKVTVGEITRFKCHYCDKIFSNTQNVKRHMMSEHNSKKDNSTTCQICGVYISHKTNLNRHIKMHHPEHSLTSSKLKDEHFQEVMKNSSELTKKVFATPKKQKYMEYITIINLENDNCFKYQCLICMKENGKSKVWSQNLSNGGTSNIRRHLSTIHPDDFQRLEASINGEGLLPTMDDIQ